MDSPFSLTCHFDLRKVYIEPTKCQLIWPNGFREDLFNWSVTTIFVVPSARNTDIVYRTSHTVNKSLCLPVSVEKICKISANQKQELSMATMFSSEMKRTFHWCFIPNVGSFGEAVSAEKMFMNRLTNKKKVCWRYVNKLFFDEISNFMEDLP